MPENSPTYEDLAVDLLIAKKENAMLRKELRKAYKRWIKLERELEAARQ